MLFTLEWLIAITGVSEAVSVQKRASNLSSTAQSYVTTSDSTNLIAPGQAPLSGTVDAACSLEAGSCVTFAVDDSINGYKQQITGFGAAFTDTTVAVLSALPETQLGAALQDLMADPSAGGNNFNLFRHTIGSTDLTPAGDAYTFDDSAIPDVYLSNFTLGLLGQKMLNLIAKSQSIYPVIKVIGSPWSPPGWMKLNGLEYGSTLNNNLNSSYYQQYANYLVQYLRAYAADGVNIEAITIQNEPLYSSSSYPTNYIDQYTATDLTRDYIAPALSASGLATQIWAYDHNTDAPSYPQTVANGARGAIGGIAWHCYAGDEVWSAMTDFATSYPNLPQYMTECWTSPTTSWYHAADFTIGPLMNYGSGIIAWNMASNSDYGPAFSGGCDTCRGLIVTSSDGQSYTKTLDYYILGQFSRFINRGAYALETSGSVTTNATTKIKSQSFLNPDGGRVVVIESTFNEIMHVSINFTSGDIWSGLIAPSSVNTWILPAGVTQNTTTVSPNVLDNNVLVPATTAQAELLGCFGDDVNARALSNRISDVTTVEACISACRSLGYRISGIEYTYQCFCDNYITSAPITESRCAQYSCQGNSTETCGGDNALQVYSFNSSLSSPTTQSTSTSMMATPDSSSTRTSILSNPSATSTTITTSTPNPLITGNTPPAIYIGCFSDSVDNRALTRYNDVGTVEACVTQCQSAGFSLAGLEYYYQCFCGNAVSGTQLSDSICSSPCNDIKTETCGNNNALQVYQIGTSASSTLNAHVKANFTSIVSTFQTNRTVGTTSTIRHSSFFSTFSSTVTSSAKLADTTHVSNSVGTLRISSTTIDHDSTSMTVVASSTSTYSTAMTTGTIGNMTLKTAENGTNPRGRAVCYRRIVIG